jgi:YD repeat-containing protein
MCNGSVCVRIPPPLNFSASKAMNGRLAGRSPGEIAATNFLTTTYRYDALNRLTAVDYSNGRFFGYEYDRAGNVLTYTHNLDGPEVVTSYAYDAANQLVAARDGDGPITWYYHFDGNGSLVEILPENAPGAGARRYTYSAAGYLMKAEQHDGTAYQTQAEMAYDGLGQRLRMTAYGGGASITTHYVMDTAGGARPLAATAGAATTFYLFGLEAIGEQTTGWSYYLRDSLGSVRQVTDAVGEVLLSRSFTPWGEVSEQNGSGDITWGYFGGLLDAATGLIYVGDGQYYDPSTGRFLTRQAQPGKSNPYVPWGGDGPAGMLIGPLALAALLCKRRKGGGKPGRGEYLLLAVLTVLAMGVMLAGCKLPKPSENASTPPSHPPTETRTLPPPQVQVTHNPTGTPPQPPTEIPRTPVTCPTPGTKNWLPEKVIFTRYVTVKEDDDFFTKRSGGLPIETKPGGIDTTLEIVPVYHFYVGNKDNPNWSVFWNGSGKLDENNEASMKLSGGKKFVQVDTNNNPVHDGYPFHAAYYFTDEIYGACGEVLEANMNVIAVAKNKFGTIDHQCGAQYYINIPGLENTIFTVKDSGTFEVGENQPDHFNIYVGVQDHESFVTSPLAQYDGQLVQVAKAQP